jgi:hypothetical protein
VVRGRRLTAWAMARPVHSFTKDVQKATRQRQHS